MKRKRGSKSKERDKNKSDEAKSHKHIRRKRKSSDSESGDDSSEVTVEQVEDAKTRPTTTVQKTDEQENNAVNTRITRHSKRLAAISTSSDELKEEPSEITSSPVKTGKLSPYSNSSPSNKECKKRDTGTPDKHRSKEQDVWKVKSANGAGSGELQKLKICRQRSPENIPLPDDPQPNNLNESQFPVEGPREAKEATEEPTEEPSVEEGEEKAVSYEVNLADIELPAAKFVEKPENSSESTNDVVETIVEDNTDTVLSQVEVLPSTAVEDCTNSSNVVACEEKLVLEEDVQPTSGSDAAATEYIENVTKSVNEIQLPPDFVDLEKEKNETTIISEETQIPVEKSINASVTPHSKIPEVEDVTQAEIVLTVDENAIEESNLVITLENEPEPCDKKETPTLLQESSQIVIKSVDMDEVYDYENDDTKEEGELSANDESISPIHEIFKKYPSNLRTRTWGSCGISHFNRSNTVVDENTLKEYNIKKRTISKEEFDASDSEDLIFVKEIREENIVHEIESETNNTSFYDKDDDDVIPSSPQRKNNLEIKKMSLESDRILDKSNKRITKDRALNQEGKTVLYITNLVRPFTVNQLRELLLRTGRIVEDGFWIDSIKSKCYVQFETEDEALETRHALHGIRWPVNNPKVLNVQFATQDELLSAQAQTHESEIPRKTEPLVISNHADSTQKRIDWKKHFEQYDERPKKIKDVREWDIGKPAHPDDMMYAEAEDPKRKVEQEASRRNRKDKRRRNEISDDEIAVKKPRKQITDNQPIPEAKLLDDLFRRTKAAPSIYWLPLSEEQIASKQEMRRKHLEDMDKQMKKENSDRQDSRRRERERGRRHSRR